ncbi:LysR family transcriptional regulator [Sphingomonas donggukensis]|uniref:LysR family transcriptional regulator n=1 Tax=Sphingomonas donggukensis TaxID=2949093 RepID=A0ABY4TS05_9SPHN|nr:LysR family transcriptional regulator [Sphingomonas donggukensis]URW75093.1 LysR family transcriptional regulator [Sphingomonas donggukensis]
MVSPFDLNLRHLGAIPAIVRLGNMSAAAEASNLSQPALTQGLAKIERQLGVKAFERAPGGMIPTPEGRLIAARVDAAFGHLTQATRYAGRHRRGFNRPERLMTATQLRSYLALADAGSFVDAARATGWSQPALHRAVRDLEQLFASPLVERRGRGIALSADGRAVARGIRLAASELAAAIAELRPDQSMTGRLVVGAMPLSRAWLLPRAIAKLLAEAPGATMAVVEGSWSELVEPLRDGEIDIMIGALRAEIPVGLDQQPLLEDRLAVLARHDHPLAAATALTRAELARYPWIVGPVGSPIRAHWERLFAGDSPPPQPVECGSVITIRGVLAQSDCLTLLSTDQVAVEIAAGILKPLTFADPELVRVIGLTARSDWRPTGLQQRLIEILRRTGEEATSGNRIVEQAK